MNAPLLQFPSDVRIVEILNFYKDLQQDFYIKKGLTQEIVKLAKVRFANCQKTESQIRNEVTIMLADLLKSKDFDLNFGEVTDLEMIVKFAMLVCAKSIN